MIIKPTQLLAISLFVASSFLGGIYVGAARPTESDLVDDVMNKEDPVAAGVDFEPFWRAWRLLDERQIDASEITDQEKVWAAIEGLAEGYGDPYTVFFPPKENEMFEEEISGNFQGVGMEVSEKDDAITVVAPLKGTPAERAGVRPGDIILQIDGTTTANLNIDEAIDLIRGEAGTEVVLTVYREGESAPLDISIVRAVIEIPTIETEDVEGVFRISLYNFSAPAAERFGEALRDFRESGDDKLIVDVRGNPGGFLEAAVDIASHFLPAGEVVVSELGKDGEELRVHRSKGYETIDTENVEIVVLVDRGSASASEILAGALAQNGVAVTMGTQSFGKGSVQELVPITRETSLKVTIAEWVTPDGTSISEEGITPEIEVEFDPEFDGDNQLQEAINYLNR